MRVRILHNDLSGYGAAAALAGEFREALVAADHQVDSRTTGNPAPLADLRGTDLLLIVGGDGTVHHALPAAIAAGVPIYQAPTGTENLFAREWGMDRSFATLERRLRDPLIASCDAGLCMGRPFAIMCSVGFDASIIHRRSARRKPGEGHRAYVEPLLSELVNPTFPRLRIEIDGRLVVDDGQGVAIVANSRQYAARLDPACRARMDDGLLDLVFLPCTSRVEALSLGVLSLMGGHVGEPEVVYRQGRSISVEVLGEGGPWQVDGEPLGSGDGRAGPGASSLPGRLEFGIAPGAIRVLAERQAIVTDPE